MTTFEILQDLQNDVGSRRVGTEGETRAQQWLKARCESLQLPVEFDAFTYIGNEYFRPLLNLFIFAWILVNIGISFAGYDAISLISYAILVVFLTFVLKRVDVRLANTPSQNLLAGLTRPFSEYLADPDKGTAVLVCAHYDTPRNFPSYYAKLRGMFRFLGPLAILGLLLYVLVALIELIWNVFGQIPGVVEQILSAAGWATLVLTLPFLVLIITSTLHRLVSHKSDSPGADDNGSGTALVLALARRFKEKPPENLDLFFGWWGAEEMGLFGSRQFVRQVHGQLDKDRLHIINADCVGAGRYLSIHTGQGTIRRKATESATVERLEKVARMCQVETSRSWESIISGGSSDQAGWIDRGFKNATLILRAESKEPALPARLLGAILRLPDANQYELDHIHTPEDTLETIKEDILESSTAVAEAYIRDLDADMASEEIQAAV